MLDDAKTLPDDPSELKELVTLLASELKNRDLKIADLQHRLAGHNRHRFGATSESLDQLQLALENEEIAVAAVEEVEPSTLTAATPETKAKPRRKPLPDHLDRNRTVIAPGDACTKCGGDLKTLGEDVTEELEYVPGRFVVNRFVRPGMACKCCESIVQAPLPSRPIERGRPGPGLLAHVLVSKFADHLPLYRQSNLDSPNGSSRLSRRCLKSTQWRRSAWWCRPSKSAARLPGYRLGGGRKALMSRTALKACLARPSPRLLDRRFSRRGRPPIDAACGNRRRGKPRRE